MSGLLELAARVEAATGPDRELDCLIWAATSGYEVVWTGADGHLLVIDGSAIGSIDPGKRQRNFSCNRPATGPGSIPAFSASLDAAMSLVPEGCGWIAGWGQTNPSEPMGGARISRNARFAGYDANYDVFAEGEAATPALALVSAALRARASIPGDAS